MSDAESEMHADHPCRHPVPGEVNLDQSLLNELRQLIQRGREVLYSCGWNGKVYTAFKPGGIEVLKFRAQALGLMRQVFGESSRHHCVLKELAQDRSAAERGYHIKQFVDVLERAYRECQRQQFFNASVSLLAGLGDDLIELAEAVSNAGCHLEAARRAGPVLKHVLRRLGGSRGIEDAGEMSADELNDVLLKAKAYEQSVHRRIGACLQIARDVGNQRGVCIPEEELAEMVRWVRDFAAQNRLVGGRTQRMKQ